MDTIPPTRRRWYRFSLRTLLVVVTLLCLICGYLGWAIKWKQQRKEFLNHYYASRWGSRWNISDTAPWSLRILREEGVSHLDYDNAVEGELLTATRLFPEARICFRSMNKEGVTYGLKRTRTPYHQEHEIPYYKNGVLFREELLMPVEESE